MTTRQMQHAKLDQYKFVDVMGAYAMPSEKDYIRLEGIVSDHPRADLRDGSYVYTSSIKDLSLFHEMKVGTRNTIYELGTIDADYKAWYDEQTKTVCDNQ